MSVVRSWADSVSAERPVRRSAVAPMRRAWSRTGPAAIPCLLGLAYLGLIVARMPQVIAWQNADSDVASSYSVATAILHGHAGQAQFSTQGSWLQLAWEAISAHLPLHRLIWELYAPTLGLATLAALWWTVARLAGRLAGTLAAVMLGATSPDGLMNLVSAPWHNTSTLGAVLLAGYLVWLDEGPRGRRSVATATAAVSVLGGVLLACDHLFMIIGLLPFLAASAAVADRGRAIARAIALIVGAAVVAWLVTAATRALDLRTTTPGLALASAHMMLVHLGWLQAGLLRLGNGRSVEAHGTLLTPLVVAAGVVTVAALLALGVATGRALAARRREPLRAMYTAFWCSSVVCALLAYVLTSAVYEPSDRYLFVVVVAVAATTPLLLGRGRWSTRAIAAGATVYVTAGLVAFALGAMHTPSVIITGRSAGETQRLQALVRRDHLGVGYAGYWNASSLEWSSGERLHVYPLLGSARSAAPMFSMRVADWYRPRPHTSSYLVLAPGDPTLPDRAPRWLPSPARTIRLGPVTVEEWRFDIARAMSASEIAIPGLATSRS